MSRSKWLLAGAVALSIGIVGVAPRSTLAKQQPPPPGPKIIGIVQKSGGDYLALTSDGAIYSVRLNVGTQCQTDNVSASLLGNLFGGPPPSPVVEMFEFSDGLLVSLENGELWGWCSSASPAPVSVLVGDIFTSAGVTPAQLQGLAPLSGVRAPAGSLENAVGRVSPNPSTGASRIEYATKTAGTVRLRIFDAQGRLVRTIERTHGSPGSHTITWDGCDERGSRAASGTYFCEVRYPDGSVGSRSVVLAR